MARKTLSKEYCICVQEDGSPREIARTGGVITYKAIEYRSGRPVALQVIPISSADEKMRTRFEEQARAAQKLEHVNVARVFDVRTEDDHIVFVSEFLLGETAEAWLVAHGPMPADAVLRVGLQVLGALADATFHGMTHRAIQPSNLLIVPGASPDGGWPFIKLLNFGLAGLKLYSDEKGATELVPTIAPQFASPEQLENGTVDFRSEIFSLGATMCFLLTGAVPLASTKNRAGMAERALPHGAQMPRSVRKLLRQMLQSDREQRPHDPVAFAEQMRECLHQIERRQRGARRIAAVPAVPVTAALNEPPIERPRRRVVPAALAIAALLLVLAVAAAAILPNQILRTVFHRERDIASIGVPVGVDENSNAPPPQTKPPARAVPIPSAAPTQPARQASAVVQLQVPPTLIHGSGPKPAATAARATPAALANVENRPTPAPTASREEPPALPSPKVEDDTRVTEQPEPPGEGPEEVNDSRALIAQQDRVATTPPETGDTMTNNGMKDESAAVIASPEQQAPAVEQSPPPVSDSVVAKSETASSAEETPSRVESPKTETKKKGATKSKRSRVARARQTKPQSDLPPLQVGSTRAEFVGTNSEGKWVLRLPSGETVLTPPVPNPDNAPVEKHGPVRKVKIRRALPPDEKPPVVALPVPE